VARILGETSTGVLQGIVDDAVAEAADKPTR